jgi:hypothetical protein
MELTMSQTTWTKPRRSDVRRRRQNQMERYEEIEGLAYFLCRTPENQLAL